MKSIVIFLLTANLCYGQRHTHFWKYQEGEIGQSNGRSLPDVLSLTDGYTFKVKEEKTDPRNFRHVKYQAYFHQAEIFGAEVIAHFDGLGNLYLLNGNLPTKLRVHVNSSGQNDALILSKEFFPELLKDEPVSSLIDHSNNTLRFNNDQGESVLILPLSKHFSDTATAVTRFSGNQIICTTSLGNNFILSEVRNGVAITTYDAQNKTVDQLTDDFATPPDLDSLPIFTDIDNFWDLRNERMDELATDIHWGTEMSFDYFLKFHNWLGLDNAGGDITSIIHLGKDWDEAFYLPPPFNFLGYGDGGPVGPNATLDVVAHEFTHGVVHYSSGLIYIGESSILDEGLADIFGTAVKFYINLPFLEKPWILAEQLGEYRDISNPKSKNQPDTYLGEFWYTGSQRGIFAHRNNGIINYWFYLISEGGSGRNDHQFDYSVEGIGMDKSAQIIFDAMAFYLTSLSDFFDFKSATIQVAHEIFGENSTEVATVKNAWSAVGVTETITSTEYPKRSGIIISDFTGYASVSFLNTLNATPDFVLINLEGKSFEINPVSISSNEFHISTQNLSPGLYLLRVSDSREITTKKIIVKPI